MTYQGYWIEARGERDWIVNHIDRYVGAVTRFPGVRFAYRTSQSVGRNYYDSLPDAVQSLKDFDASR